MHRVKKVENPKYQHISEIASDFWDNWLVISNTDEDGQNGIVRYYCYSRKKKLFDIIMKMDKDFDTYGDCMIRFVGPSRGWIWALNSVSNIKKEDNNDDKTNPAF